MKNFVASGEKLDVVVTAPIPSGGVLFIGQMPGIANKAGVIGETVAFDTKGAFTLPKTTGETNLQGQRAYWDTVNLRVTATQSATTKRIGHFFSDAQLAATTTVVVLPNAAGSGIQGPAASVAQSSVANATGDVGAGALANDLKVKVNSIIQNMKDAGLMVSP